MGTSVGKWTKHKILLKEVTLANYLPETQLLRKGTFHKLLSKYGEVIVKPCLSFHGKGVTQVTTVEDDNFSIHFGYKKKILKSAQEAYDFLRESYYSRRKKYIVQQKISLATINNCPFDIRVMVQRKKESNQWQVTGKLAKVAARGFIITNVAQAVLPVEEAIERSKLNFSTPELLAEIDQVSLLTANHLLKYYSTRRTIGLDIGIDINGKVWIIEANLKPDILMFKLLEDRSSYKMIRWFRKG